MRWIPYGRQWVDDEDIEAVAEVLRSDWITTGPKVAEFEELFANVVKAKYAIAVSSGTAALHAAMFALDIAPGDEVIVPTMTFAASANCVIFQRGTPIFVDIDPDTLLLNPAQVEAKITPQTKAIIPVDYAGHPCDYDRIQEIADRYGLAVVADACHSLGGKYKGREVGSLADLSVFSFHPVKHITTGEGGMITTHNEQFVRRMRTFRNHGITTDHYQREMQGSWFYEMVELGYNYRITDFQSALGISQLRKLDKWVSRRREIARQYNEAFVSIKGISPLAVRPGIDHAYHLYIVKVQKDISGLDRATIYKELRSRGVGVNVHYIPVHMHPFYRNRFGTGPGLCPVAELAYEQILSLPVYPGMKDQDVDYVIENVKEILSRLRKK